MSYNYKTIIFSSLLFAVMGSVWVMSHSGESPLPESALMGDFKPPPTEHWLALNSEKENKSRRKAWFKERHRASADTNWKAVERGNGLKQIQKRNALTGATSNQMLGEWIERGSNNQAGRVHVAIHGGPGEALYIGSAMGGIWRGEVDGTGWTPLGDNLYGGAHSMAAVPTGVDDEIALIAGTDWGSVHRSIDDGLTWNVPDGMSDLYGLKRLLMSSDGSRTLFGVIGQGSYWDQSYSVVRSTDSGASFEKIYSFGPFAGDIFVPRDGTGGLYVASRESLLYSDDGGDSLNSVGAWPEAKKSIELTGSEAGAPTFYVVRDNATLARSDDGGLTWQDVSAVSDYWQSLAASITDPNVFAWGGVEVHHTVNGGESFDVVNEWYDYYDDMVGNLHADIPGIDVLLNEDGVEVWYISTDGGLFRSTDNLESVENLSLNGLRISQYYGTLTHIDDESVIAAGAQDQGYQVSTALDDDGDNYAFDQIISGDYAHLTSGDGTHDMVFSVYPGFILVQLGEGAEQLSYAEYPLQESERYFAWLPPVLGDSEDPEDFFFCSTRLYHYDFTGHGWEVERLSSFDFAVDDYEYISALRFDREDPQTGWLVTSYGKIYMTFDRGVNWSRVADSTVTGQYFYGTAFEQSYHDPDILYVGGSGYDGSALYRSSDGGQTWGAFGTGLPETLIYSLVALDDDSGRLVAGTETGPYMLNPTSGEWTDIGDNRAPVTIYWSAELLRGSGMVRFGTYGRGIWDYLPPEAVAVPEETGTVAETGDITIDTETIDLTVVHIAGGGCGCQSTAGSYPVWWLMGLGVLAGLRRKDRHLAQ